MATNKTLLQVTVTVESGVVQDVQVVDPEGRHLKFELTVVDLDDDGLEFNLADYFPNDSADAAEEPTSNKPCETCEVFTCPPAARTVWKGSSKTRRSRA